MASEQGKRCTKCQLPKQATDFYRDKTRRDGMTSTCKQCRAAVDRRHYYGTLEYQRARKRKYRAENRDALLANERRYDTTQRDPVKREARAQVRAAVASGRLVRPSSCSDCRTPCKPHGHHADYSRPLDVEWLCSECHGVRHRQPVSEAA